MTRMSGQQRVKLNVGGGVFLTTVPTLRSLPRTRLGRLAAEIATTDHHHQQQQQPQQQRQEEVELYFDRNPEMINSLLDLYRTGNLHLPSHLCGQAIAEELAFWDIPTEMVLECCYGKLEGSEGDAAITNKIDKYMTTFYDPANGSEKLSRLHKIWLTLENPLFSTAAKVWSCVFFSAVLLSVLVSCLQTAMAFREPLSWVYPYASALNMSAEAAVADMNLARALGATSPCDWIKHTDRVLLAFFLVDFLLRFAFCPNKCRFMARPRSWLDVFLLAQHILTIMLSGGVIGEETEFSAAGRTTLHLLHSSAIIRILRIFYLARNFDLAKLILLSTKASGTVLLFLAVAVLSLATLFGAVVYLVEMYGSEFTFHSVPYAMWYAVVTMTTVGYGDVTPVTVGGRLVGVLCALCGVVVLALPLATVATNFSTYHSNLGSCQHRQRRAAFLKDNPDFVAKKGLEEEEEEEEGDVVRVDVPGNDGIAGSGDDTKSITVVKTAREENVRGLLS